MVAWAAVHVKIVLDLSNPDTRGKLDPEIIDTRVPPLDQVLSYKELSDECVTESSFTLTGGFGT